MDTDDQDFRSVFIGAPAVAQSSSERRSFAVVAE
jgi:hypothetical protein